MRQRPRRPIRAPVVGVLGPPKGEFCAGRLRDYVSTDQVVSNAMEVTRPDLDLASRHGDCESRGAAAWSMTIGIPSRKHESRRALLPGFLGVANWLRRDLSRM